MNTYGLFVSNNISVLVIFIYIILLCNSINSFFVTRVNYLWVILLFCFIISVKFMVVQVSHNSISER